MPQRYHVDGIAHDMGARRHDTRRLMDKGTHGLWYRARDLSDQILSGARQHRVVKPGHPLRTQRCHLDFIGSQHQRRHVIAAIQHITDPGFSPDRHALGHERGDIAIDGPFGRFHLRRHSIRRHWPWRATQNLDDLEQPVGAAHLPPLLPSY